MSRDRDLPAGRELDALVAEKVMGCTVSTEYPATVLRIPVCTRATHDCGGQNGVPRYSTDIRAAWEVVEKVGDKFSLERNGNEWSASWYQTRPTSPWDYVVKARAIAATAPHAICLAALRAVGALEQEKRE